MSDTSVALLVAGLVIAGGILAATRMLPRLRQPSRTVYDWEHGLLYVDGRFAGLLAPGRYRLLGWRDRLIVTLPRLARFDPLANVDVTSADRLSYRLSAMIAYEIVDPRAAHEGDYRQRLRLAGSEALVRLAAERSLETVLAERSGLGTVALERLGPSLCGCRLDELSISTVTMPPELRRLYAEIERARLEGQAALERARGEQAALRSLANAARMLKGNPELMNLRLLQALSASGGKGGATLVLGREAFSGTGTGDAPRQDA